MTAKSEEEAAITEMECGTSLAEDAWTVPSIADGVSIMMMAAASSASASPDSSKSAAAKSSVEEAWNNINKLRSKLASDVVSDPAPSSTTTTANNGSSNQYNLPTFISPYDSTAPSARVQQTKGTEIPLVYCDQTASQRPVRSIEDYIRTTSMPCHANTHTNITYTGSQSTAFVSEARQIVGEATNARITGKAALDTVIFGGNGVTGVVGILVDCLNLRGIVNSTAATTRERPVVFVGPHEHHSNLLPWRESGCEVVTIPEHPVSGMVDLNKLESLLQIDEYNPRSSGRLVMGAFSAVSNVTGIIADVDAIAIILHRYGALAFFDYASGAPYVKMDMNPNAIEFGKVGGDNASKDAIYFSPHKCYGGTSTPGVLVVKKHLISQTNPPTISGGGTVFYVTNNSHRFLSNRTERYEGGTPDGIGIQRVGLALLAGRRVACEYKRIVQGIMTQSEVSRENEKLEGQGKKSPPRTLLQYECSTYDRVVGDLKEHAPNLIMLGCTGSETAQDSLSCVGRHLPMFSFLIRCGPRFLHYNFVCAILNDVFGIQSRGGCQCAGPYSQRLLGLNTIVNGEEVPNTKNQLVERALLQSNPPCELLRPGYTRLSLPFKGVREEEVSYVTQALIWVSKNGWVLLPQYTCDHRTSEWRHWSRRGKPLGKVERRWLSRYDILAAPKPVENNGVCADHDAVIKASTSRLTVALKNANSILHAAKHDPRFLSQVEKMNPAHGMLGSGGEGGMDTTLEELRWYAYPQEISTYLKEGLDCVPETLVDDALLGAICVRMDGVRSDLGGDIVIMKSGENGVEMMEESSVQDVDDKPRDKDLLLQFQEGDHVGEAPYQEIKAGFEDGELSEACDVFSRSKDEWLSIEDFILEHEASSEAAAAGAGLLGSKKRNLSVMEEKSPPSHGVHSMKIDSLSSAPPSFDAFVMNDASPQIPLPVLTNQTLNNNNLLSPTTTLTVGKREKKKPSRDSSQWGQSAAPHIAPSKPTFTSSSDSAAPANSTNDNTAKNSTTTTSNIGTATTTTYLPSKPKEDTSNKSKKNKNKNKLKPPPKMMRFITQAMIQWEMIQEGDRLLLGLSGGKDSLTLLHCLLEFQRKLPVNFEIEVCTIDPMTPSFDPSPLIPYVEGLGLKYHYIKDDIVERANTSGKDGKIVTSLCAFCARMKRGNLYTCAKRNNCNKLVLAQHLDDCAESFFMSIMHNGFVRTMKANYEINAGGVSVIRPLVYCRESLMTEFAKSANLPVINENCPACFEEPKERARVKKLLSREETMYPNLYDHIRRALIPVMHDDSTSIMRSYLEDTIANSRKVPGKKLKRARINHGSNGAVKMKSTAAAPPPDEESKEATASTSLKCATEGDLVAELARRRASKYKMNGAMKQLKNGDSAEAADCDKLPDDATGQMCSLTGGDGMIPCRELME